MKVNRILILQIGLFFLLYASVFSSSIEISEAYADPGDTAVTISVTLDNSMPYSGCEMELQYNKTYLALNRIEVSSRMSTQSEFGYYEFSTGRVSMVFFDISGNDLPSDTGVIFDAYFDIKSDSSEGIADISITEISAVDDALEYDLIDITNGAILIPVHICGDPNDDRLINLLDITYLIAYLYTGGPEPVDLSKADVNSSGDINLLDITYLIAFLYQGGPEPNCNSEAPLFASNKTPNAQLDVIVQEDKTILSLNSPIDLYGIEMVLKNPDNNSLSVRSCIKDFPVYFYQENSEIIIGMLDPKGQKFIPKGENNILEINGIVEVDSVLGSDKAARPVYFGDNISLLPREFSLDQNYPNPFNPNTVINFALPKSENVKLEIYNILGRKVITLVDGKMDAGYHSVNWDGIDSDGHEVSTGVYFYKIRAGNYKNSKKMMLLK